MRFLPGDLRSWASQLVAVLVVIAMCSATTARAQPREAGSFLPAPAAGRGMPDAGAQPSAAPATNPPPSASAIPAAPGGVTGSPPPVIGEPTPVPSAIPAPPATLPPVTSGPSRSPWSGTTTPLPGLMPSPTMNLPRGVPQRLQALDTNLNALAVSGSSIASGVVQTITGGLFIGLGVWAHRGGSPQTGNYFYLFGASSIGSAVIVFTLRPNPQKYAVAFSNMPVTTPESAMAKLQYGEQSLHHLAVMNRSARILDGALNIAVGAISIPIMLGPEGFSSGDAYTYILAISGGLTIITGLISLLQPSNAERRWKAYRKLVTRLEAQSGGRASLLDRGFAFGGTIVPGGGFVGTMQLRF